MTRIVLQHDDGRVTLRVPAPNAKKPKETQEQFLQRITNSHLDPDETPVGRVEAVPSDPVDVWEYEAGDAVLKQEGARAVRNAWVWDGGNVIPDPAKENEILMERLRAVRNRLLDDSDVAMTRALEDGDAAAQARLKSYRETLRDLPQNVSDPRQATFPERPAEVQPRAANTSLRSN